MFLRVLHGGFEGFDSANALVPCEEAEVEGDASLQALFSLDAAVYHYGFVERLRYSDERGHTSHWRERGEDSIHSLFPYVRNDAAAKRMLFY